MYGGGRFEEEEGGRDERELVLVPPAAAGLAALALRCRRPIGRRDLPQRQGPGGRGPLQPSPAGAPARPPGGRADAARPPCCRASIKVYSQEVGGLPFPAASTASPCGPIHRHPIPHACAAARARPSAARSGPETGPLSSEARSSDSWRLRWRCWCWGSGVTWWRYSRMVDCMAGPCFRPHTLGDERRF